METFAHLLTSLNGTTPVVTPEQDVIPVPIETTCF